MITNLWKTTSKQTLAATPMCLQGMLLSLQMYDLSIHDRKGMEMYLPDMLSGAYLVIIPGNQYKINNPEQVYMLHFLLVTNEWYTEIQNCTQRELKPQFAIILLGWPDTRQEVTMAI